MSVGLDDLPAVATHEDIASFVDRLMAPPEKDGEKKDEKVAENDKAADTTSKETPASDETPAGDDTAGKKAGEDSAQAPEEDRSWLTDDLRAEVSALGIDEEDLDEFSTREELDRALRFVYRDASRTGKSLSEGQSADDDAKASQSKSDDRVRDKDGRFVAEGKQPAKAKPAETSESDELDLSEFDEDFGKKVNIWAKGLRSAYERQIRTLEERFAHIESVENQRAARAFEQSVDAAIDSLDSAELFGKTGKESKDEMDKRRQLVDTVRTIMVGLHAQGRQIPLQALVSRAHRMEFAEHLSKKERKALTKKVADQAKMRQGGGRSKPTDSAEPIEEWAQRRYKELGGD